MTDRIDNIVEGAFSDARKTRKKLAADKIDKRARRLARRVRIERLIRERLALDQAKFMDRDMVCAQLQVMESDPRPNRELIGELALTCLIATRANKTEKDLFDMILTGWATICAERDV